ncbi:MAG: histidine phosphatase family protein [Hyphomicrobiaceae bacterium]
MSKFWFGSRYVYHCFVFAVFLLASGAVTEADEARLWAKIKDGEAFAIIRHAMAPGTGDPENFSVADCTTQRNLSQRGREQARNIGRRFRANSIVAADIYSSEWCRCMETAKLLAIGEVRTLPVMNSFYETMERREIQTRALRQWLTEHGGTKPLILVSHQVNILALTGRSTGSGEAIVAKIDTSGQVTVLGSLD